MSYGWCVLPPPQTFCFFEFNFLWLWHVYLTWLREVRNWRTFCMIPSIPSKFVKRSPTWLERSPLSWWHVGHLSTLMPPHPPPPKEPSHFLGDGVDAFLCPRKRQNPDTCLVKPLSITKAVNKRGRGVKEVNWERWQWHVSQDRGKRPRQTK